MTHTVSDNMIAKYSLFFFFWSLISTRKYTHTSYEKHLLINLINVRLKVSFEKETKRHTVLVAAASAFNAHGSAGHLPTPTYTVNLLQTKEILSLIV